MKKCDIIVPIYNAYDCIAACIDSIIQHTNLEENGLILIDDKSPDERILPLLKEYKKKYPHIELLINEKNLGFVGTVNRGMKHSKNDVVLLNSDTEVTKNWLDKMKKCAYSGEMIATVTPLSNNATLASVPKFYEPNILPEGYTLEKMAELVERISFHDYPEIPTGHGFCLYIKREVLDKVGYFDQEAFGKGYGEENDFCYRCFHYGYRHLLCDDVYIYHKESQSFQEDKKELIEEGLKVLNKRYPEYVERLNEFIAINPIRYIAENIALELGKTENHPNILYIIHDWKDVKNHLGGTTLHAYDLIKNMRNQYNFHVLSFEDEVYKLYSYYKETETTINFPSIISFKDVNFYNKEYKKMLENIIDSYHIHCIHIHHLKNHFFDITDVIKEKKIYTMITLHDYYCVCPFINKIYKNEKYCDKPTIKMCNECIHCMMENPIDIMSWRENWKRLLTTANQIIVPSVAAQKEIEKTYPDFTYDVMEHGIDIEKEFTDTTLGDTKKFNIAFVGAIGLHKGSRILKDLIASKKLGHIRIHLFGKLDSYNYKWTRKFVDHGKYKREDLKKLVKQNKIKLVCLFSTWPETYSYTMTESIACGIPILAFDMGAIAERIHKYHLGWTISKTATTEDIIKRIKEISEDKEGYNKVIQSINQYQIKTTKEMADEYASIYKKHLKKDYAIEDDVKQYMKDTTRYIPTAIYNNYEWVFSTLKWRMISKLKIPKSIKKAYRKVRRYI